MVTRLDRNDSATFFMRSDIPVCCTIQIMRRDHIIVMDETATPNFCGCRLLKGNSRMALDPEASPVAWGLYLFQPARP